ncbi:MAG TPA: family 16 glycoside hydrolase [Candidatus Aquilonibacter sp.]|nr:family 16 glycoside hydrolase [Candidatus Aquilonibacter sp.]
MRKLFFCLCLVFAASAFGAEIKFDFDDFPAGQTPSGFHSALAGGGQPGDWKIIMDAVPSAFTPLTPQAPAVMRQGVLAQLSQDPTDNRFPMLIYNGETFKDFTLATRFKIVSGVAEQMAGIVFRYQNESNFYVFRASALGHNLRFYKVVNGQFADPSAPLDMNISTNVWHTLTVQCEGDQINCSLDDTTLPAIETPNTFPEGKIGFWTMSDAVTYFGNTTITYKPLVPAAQMLVQNIMAKEPRILGLRIFALDDQGRPHIIGSKDEKEIGQPGTDGEKAAITDGTVSFGRGPGTVAVILPFRDRNGIPMAAVWVRLKSFFGETQDTAVTRATMIVKQMEAQITSRQDLMQ